jgi:xylulokinase
MSDAAGTLWLDQAARDWADSIIAATGLSRAEMPALVEGSARAGSVGAALLREFGMNGPVIVAGGAGDAAAAAVGIGAVNDGDAFISLGTSAQLFVTDAEYRLQPESLIHAFAHALPQRWFRMAAMLNGASCLEWAAHWVGADNIVLLLDRVEARYREPSRITFLPYLSGERTPHNDPAARGIFAGLDASATAENLVQAVLEGVAFSLAEAQLLMREVGLGLDRIAAVGGGARSRFWMQLIANVLGVEIVRYRGSEAGPAVGAARLARLAVTDEKPDEVCAMPPDSEVLMPDPPLTAAYRERFEDYRRLYRNLKAHFAEGAEPPESRN